MKAPTTPAARLLGLMTGVLLLVNVPLPLCAQTVVEVKGRLSTPEEIITPGTVVLTTPEGSCQLVTLRANGRFTLRLDQEGPYFLWFHEPGCRDKVVGLDTRHMERRVKNGPVSFEVVLSAQDATRDAQPFLVGRIDFHRSNGRMQVHYLTGRDADALLVNTGCWER